MLNNNNGIYLNSPLNNNFNELKELKLNGWNNFVFPINNVPLTNSIISFFLSVFWKVIVPKLENRVFGLMLKVKFINNSVRSISNLQIVRKESFEEMDSILNDYWNLRSEDYHIIPVSEVILSFRFYQTIENTKIVKVKDSLDKSKSNFSFRGYSLPNTMDLYKWGNVSFNDDFTNATIITSKTVSYSVTIVVEESYGKIINRAIVHVFSRGKLLFKFTDILFNTSDLSSFKRIINKQEFIFYNGVNTLKQIKRECKKIEKIRPAQFRTENFITMDLETRTIDNIMRVVSISIYDGKSFYSFYINNFKSESDMILTAFKTICIRKYTGYRVYLHNFSYFDSIFLLSIITNEYKIKPIRREGSIIELKLNFGKTGVLYFHDSMLLLPNSLAKLAKSFNVEDKGIFPYSFINNKDIPLNYDGVIPDMKYFEKLNLNEYNLYVNNHLLNNSSWNLEKEITKYCEQDVLVLHQVITKFSKEIFDLYRVDAIKYPTLPSLAFAIFRTKFMKNNSIPIILGEMYNDIFQSYTGGSVDIFKPYGENVHIYDVNSLFPSTMYNNYMPVGDPIYFEGDISLKKTNPFGFFNVKVTAPKDLKVPVLQLRIRTHSGVKTVSPVGTWEGWYFSEELNNAVNNYGYKIEIIKGYMFNKEYIFKDYVKALYKIKEENSPDKENADPSKYIIAKFLLNMLYGRFGMSPDMSTTQILSYNDAEKIEKDYVVTDVTDFNNGFQMLEFVGEKGLDNNYIGPNISVSISAAVTAYSRIVMCEYKHIPGNPPLYSDTDSVALLKPLPSKYIGSDLGKMKLEYIFKSAIFLAPKVYGGILDPVNNPKKILKKHGYQIVKIKGVKKPINYIDLNGLLYKDNNKVISQPKWYRHFDKGYISIREETYTLTVTENKRHIIYDSNNKFIDTKPFELKNGKIVNSEQTVLHYLPKT